MTKAEFEKQKEALELQRMRAEVAYYEDLASGESQKREMFQTFALLLAGMAFGLGLTFLAQLLT